jgi:integrase
MATVWQKSKVANLIRHTGGRYYGRFTLAGKTKFIALRTNVFEVAKIQLARERVKFEGTRKARTALGNGEPTMGDLLKIHLAQVAERADVGERTKTRYRQFAEYIPKTWPGFDTLRPDEITLEAVTSWRNHALTAGTGYRPMGATGDCEGTRGNAAGTFNKAVDALRLMLNMAVDRGLIHNNPLLRRGVKASSNPRKPNLPEAATLRAIFDEIEHGSESTAGWGIEIADFCRGLAFTGCRLRELGKLTWADVDFTRGIVRVSGTKTDAAHREVPMIPEARALLEKIHARRTKTASIAVDGVPFVDPSAKVFAVSEAGRSLARACEKLKVETLTHHDLRDAFATQAIEAGVDIPTVAAWLGHADGGALLMRVYAHHRRAHSATQAARVSFGTPDNPVN